MYSSNSGVCAGSSQPCGLVIRAMLTRASPVFTRPTNSSIVFGSVPSAGTTVGLSISRRHMCSGASTPTRSRERADDVARGRDEREPERLVLAALRRQHPVVVVEAVEVVGEPDRVHRDRVRAAPLGRLAHDGRELGEPLDELALLGRERHARRRVDLGSVGRLAEDAGRPRVDVLDVVDGVLARLLRGEVDVDLDRLVVAAVDEEPAREVDADLVDEVVEEDDVALSLRHLRLLAAARQVDELVEQHLDPARGRSRASARSRRTSARARGGRRRARRSRGRTRGRACRRR